MTKALPQTAKRVVFIPLKKHQDRYPGSTPKDAFDKKQEFEDSRGHGVLFRVSRLPLFLRSFAPYAGAFSNRHAAAPTQARRRWPTLVPVSMYKIVATRLA
jgi:hypothetical protein